MSTLSATRLKVVAFGDLEQGYWGAAWGEADPFVAIGSAADAPAAAGATLEGTDQDEDWQLTADGVELGLEPLGEAVAASEPGGFDQLCRVRGEASLDGGARAIECLGRRAVRVVPESSALDSIRDFSAWFSEEDWVALTAVRRRGAEGHAADTTVAVVSEPTGAIRVAEPRLSTTYDAHRRPVRVGLELWLEDDEEAESFPRRAAGEALSGVAHATAGDLRVDVRAFGTHFRGLEGLGVYFLAHVA